MNLRWRSVAVLVCVMPLLAVAGCGTQSAPGNTSTGSANKPIELSFWYGLGGANGQHVQEMVKAFNDTHPGIHVTATYQGSYSGGGPEQQKLLAAIKAGNPPDIAQIEVHAMPVFAATGKLMDLTDFMNSSSVDKPDNFLDGMLVSTQFNGRYYGVPLNRSVPVLYYNRTMFEKAGIQHPPATWDELAQDSQKLTKGSGSSKVYGFEPLVDWWPWEAAVWSGGGQILSTDNSKAQFNTAAATHVIALEQELVKEGYATVESGTNYWDLMTQDFIAGRCAMDIDSIGDAGQVQKGVGTKFQWGTAMLPKDATLAVPPGGGDMAILAGIPQDHVKAAETFIEWWTSPEETVKWSTMTGYMPVQKAALNDPQYQAFLKEHPQYQTALEELKYQHPAPASPNYLSVVQTVQQALQGIFDEGKDVMSTMNSAANQVNSILQ